MATHQDAAPIWLLHAATTPLDPRIRERILPLLEEDPARPGGLLGDTKRLGRLIAESRQEAAAAWGRRPAEVIFTSSGTEAINLALKGAGLAILAKGGPAGRIVVGATEPASVLHPARTLARLGFDLREAPVDGNGVVLLDRLEELMDEPTRLVSIAPMNAETGTLQPMARIAALARARGALLHADATLAMTRLPLEEANGGADLVSISGHRMGAPRGSGALLVREGVRLLPLIEGGTEEGGRRSGAPYAAGIVGLAMAAALLASEGESRRARLAGVTRRLEEALLRVARVRLNGAPGGRAPGMISICAAGVDGEALQTRLARRGIAVWSGSACYQETGKPSHVLLAMGVDPALAKGSLLFAPGYEMTDEQISRVARAYEEAVASLRSVAGA